MVVFTCNHCGESLQKPRVEKHYIVQCRRPKSLTCVDCFKDFRNEEYVVHTKCITEEERYAAKGSIPGGVVKKGEVKQESWTDMIKSIVQKEDNLRPSLKNLFDTLSTHANIPRKKAKFINFLKSSTGGRVNFSDIESAWDLIEKYKTEQTENNSHTQNGDGVNGEVKENGTKHKLEDEVPAKKKKMKKGQAETDECNGEASSKKKKRVNNEAIEETNGGTEVLAKKKKKVKDEQPPQSDDTEVEPHVFSFKGTILNILQTKNSISSAKLQKKVLKAYLKETGNTEYTEKTVKKYNQKLKKLPNVVIKDDIISLISEQ